MSFAYLPLFMYLENGETEENLRNEPKDGLRSSGNDESGHNNKKKTRHCNKLL